MIISRADSSEEIFFLARGKASILIDLSDGQTKRVATFSPGMTFGEMGAIDGLPRSGRIRADQDVECYVMFADDFEALSTTHPELKTLLLSNLLRSLSGRLRKANAEISVLSSRPLV